MNLGIDKVAIIYDPGSYWRNSLGCWDDDEGDSACTVEPL